MNKIANDTERLREELEREYALRLDELSKYENFLEASDANEDFQELYRKMLVVMLYAYYEGFCKKALEIYVEYLNDTQACVKDLKPIIASSTLQNEFKKLTDPNHRPLIILGDTQKEDNKLQGLARRSEFFESYVQMMSQPINLPTNLVNTESNLRPPVLKSLLYKLAMDYTIVDSGQGAICKLVNYRNSIAHGNSARGISEEEYTDCKKNALDIMDKLKTEIIDHYKEKRYCKDRAS